MKEITNMLSKKDNNSKAPIVAVYDGEELQGVFNNSFTAKASFPPYMSFVSGNMSRKHLEILTDSHINDQLWDCLTHGEYLTEITGE